MRALSRAPAVGLVHSFASSAAADLPPCAGETLRALPERTSEERLHELRVVEDVSRRSAECGF